ncbi:DUF3570 domain-containing protein [Aquabacterium sp.]|uniref:DUF3570 domain-containing protein n=1 Tax=Aquabacterium sp. TaxID=1872578 RepID=UPI0037851E36
MAAIDAGRGALEALTAAALLLPGLVSLPARAQPSDTAEGVTLQSAQYRESARAAGIVGEGPAPIRVDSLAWRAQWALPRGDGLVLAATQDTWSGATPITTAPALAQGNRPVRALRGGQLVTVGASPMLNGQLLLDAHDRPVSVDPASGRVTPASALVHTLSSASPETRQQLDLRLRQRLDEDRQLTLGAGASRERDYLSRFINLGHSIGLAQSTLTLGVSHTRSDSRATLDHDAAPYITKTAYGARIESHAGQLVLHGRRRDTSVSAGFTQILGPATLLEATLSYTRSAGDLANPYKVSSVIFAPLVAGSEAPRNGDLRALMEQRPAQRGQWTAGVKLVQHIAATDAALHLGYGLYHDDWGITAQRAEAEWLQPLGDGRMLSARLRSYSQGAARFYRDVLVTHQAYRQVRIGGDGQPVVTVFDPALLPAYFSSDQRLAAFGVLGFGLGWTQPLGRGVTLELGVDAARHAAALRWGGGSADGAFADFRYAMANATLRIDFDGAPPAAATGHGHAHDDSESVPHVEHVGLPAGVPLAHGAMAPGRWMLGLRLVNQRDAGELRPNGQPVSDDQWRTEACQPVACSTRPQRMTMQMQMLDIGYGLGEGLGLMLMPQYISAAMDSRLLEGGPPPDGPVHFGRHDSAGWGDTPLHLLWQPAAGQGRWTLGLGLSLPTGRTDLRHRRSHQQDGLPQDYGMQPGSGTWDLLPSLGYQDAAGPWAWGAQALATWRGQARNGAGYALGHRLDASAWLGRRVAPWLQLTLRAAASGQGRVRGERAELATSGSAADHPANQGGRWHELGLGAVIDGLPGAWQGSAFAFEWLQPLDSRVNGYQPTRSGTLVASWRQHF